MKDHSAAVEEARQIAVEIVADLKAGENWRNITGRQGTGIYDLASAFLELSEPRKLIADLAADNAAKEARCAKLEAALTECADDLEAYVHAEYPQHLLGSADNQRKFVRDMQPVVKARAALAKVVAD